MSETADRLVHMANQIARNFAVEGDDAAMSATAEHIRLFWDPRMKAGLFKTDRNALCPIARGAVALLLAE